ncbi:MAG: TRAFAC clade GTPase domain-containing protein [Planktothrix sp.]|uniref:TRAFAC clade GTPase domain-containing protein n=1 Tax=Planktothrix sp. TaxID=3088171 RepID=UPI0038D5087F
MYNAEELNIIMVGTRGTGKTSILAAMYEEFHKTFEQANLQTWDDTKTLRAIEECQATLKNLDARLTQTVIPTEPRLNPWREQGFIFEIGSRGKKFMKLRFSDPAGEYFNPHATPEQKEYVKSQLNQCDAVVIPVDATALMQKKTGKVSHGEIGFWHEEKNDSKRITQLLKDAYANVLSPRLVILAPVKCETYMKTDREANNLLHHIKLGYAELLDFLKSESLIDKVSVVVTPVETIGNVTFAYHKTDEDNYTNFYYYKTPINAPYSPQNGDQILRYVLLFLINVYLDKKRKFLEDEQEKLKWLEKQLFAKKEELEQAKSEFERNKKLLKDRNETWWLFREIANLFDDRKSPCDKAEDKYLGTKKEVNETTSEFNNSFDQIQATQEQIKAFNDALFRFAIGCKNNHGFAILQGHKWLEIPQPIL